MLLNAPPRETQTKINKKRSSINQKIFEMNFVTNFHPFRKYAMCSLSLTNLQNIVANAWIRSSLEYHNSVCVGLPCNALYPSVFV